MRYKDDKGKRIIYSGFKGKKICVYIYRSNIYIVQNVISLSYHDKAVPQFLEYRFLSCVSMIIKYK